MVNEDTGTVDFAPVDLKKMVINTTLSIADLTGMRNFVFSLNDRRVDS